MGWSNALNGELLTLAEAEGFDVMLTADANIKSQQNMAGRILSIVVLRANNNRLITHVEMLDHVRLELNRVGNGEIVEVFSK